MDGPSDARGADIGGGADAPNAGGLGANDGGIGGSEAGYIAPVALDGVAA